ncbi:hypothetical protein [Pseudogemmobacter faecipullorum]|uniref:Uncharacterized protein n=1 Tax=Pseudogemmobacter faecipullorum TaxID=2755041 RepID=A0ABS8CMC4_9RHOB|nr:hypothetical protein [Pseudogemmobacter faecipullorum]MCB5410552.1 hypothetical protein [Pseudogemmobacter faecipullorum]
MKRLSLTLLLCLAIASPARAESPPVTPPGPGDAASDPPLTAAEFDALTRGRTMDTHDADIGLYGVETFLSGKRVIWRDAERCMHGSWEQVGEQICFLYEDNPGRPVCWTYHDRGGWLMGFYEGRRDSVPIMLYPAQGPLVCDGFIGA